MASRESLSAKVSSEWHRSGRTTGRLGLLSKVLTSQPAWWALPPGHTGAQGKASTW